MQEILKESLKKMILNYLGFRFSRAREPLSSFRIKVIILKENYSTDRIEYWKEVI